MNNFNNNNNGEPQFSRIKAGFAIFVGAILLVPPTYALGGGTAATIAFFLAACLGIMGLIFDVRTPANPDKICLINLIRAILRGLINKSGDQADNLAIKNLRATGRIDPESKGAIYKAWIQEQKEKMMKRQQEQQ